jgi:hypothetical protein
LSAVHDCLFNLFAATLHIGGRSSIRNLRTRHAVVTGTHYTADRGINIQLLITIFCSMYRSVNESLKNIFLWDLTIGITYRIIYFLCPRLVKDELFSSLQTSFPSSEKAFYLTMCMCVRAFLCLCVWFPPRQISKHLTHFRKTWYSVMPLENILSMCFSISHT